MHESRDSSLRIQEIFFAKKCYNDKVLVVVDLHLKDIDKQSNSKNPKSVKFPSKVKKLGNNNSYEITLLGREFLKLTEPISK